MNAKSKGQKARARETEGYRSGRARTVAREQERGVRASGGRERGQFGEWNIIGASFHARGLDGSWKTSSGGGCAALPPSLPPSSPWMAFAPSLHPGNAVSIEPEQPGVRLYRFLHFMIYHAAFSPAGGSKRARARAPLA